jgi:hypothetical protein
MVKFRRHFSRKVSRIFFQERNFIDGISCVGSKNKENWGSILWWTLITNIGDWIGNIVTFFRWVGVVFFWWHSSCFLGSGTCRLVSQTCLVVSQFLSVYIADLSFGVAFLVSICRNSCQFMSQSCQLVSHLLSVCVVFCCLWCRLLLSLVSHFISLSFCKFCRISRWAP